MVILRVTVERIPPTVTIEPSARSVAGQRRHRAVDRGRDDVLDAEQRMVGDVEPEHLPLVGEQDRLVPLGDRDGRARGRVDGSGACAASAAAEQVELADRLGPLGVEARVDRLGMHPQQTLPGVAERVEGAGLDQRLDDLLVAHHRLDLGQEVGEAR